AFQVAHTAAQLRGRHLARQGRTVSLRTGDRRSGRTDRTRVAMLRRGQRLCVRRTLENAGRGTGRAGKRGRYLDSQSTDASARIRIMEFEKLASGLGMAEGPRVDERNRLYFTDAHNGGVFRRNPDGRIETLLADRPFVGGLGFAEGGGLILTGPSVALW